MQIEKEYRASEVAKMLNVHKRTVILWINKGLLSAHKRIDADRGTPYYIKESELKRFLNKPE